MARGRGPQGLLVELADNRVLMSGGVARDTAELWDPATMRWRLLASRMRHARAWHSATLLTDGRVLLVGGDAGGPAEFVFAELRDPRTEQFSPLAHLAFRAPAARRQRPGGRRRDGAGGFLRDLLLLLS